MGKHTQGFELIRVDEQNQVEKTSKKPKKIVEQLEEPSKHNKAKHSSKKKQNKSYVEKVDHSDSTE